MAYGGPESLDEIPGYLADIRAGRPTPRQVVEEITENYRAIGGRSPLLEVTRAAGRRARGAARGRLPLLPRDAPLGAVDRGGRGGDGRGRDRARGRPRPRAALQRALGREIPAARGGRARALPRPDRVRARPELPRRAGADRGVRRAGRGGRLALARGRSASACTSSSPRTASPSGCSPRAIRTTRSAARRRSSSRRARASRTSAGRGATSPRGGRPSRGPAPTSATTCETSPRAASATSSSCRSASSPTMSRSCSTSTSARAASPTSSACGSSDRRR